MSKEYKNNDFIQPFLLFHCQSSMHVHESTATYACAFFCLQTRCIASRFLIRKLAPASTAPLTCVMVLKKYSCSFIKLRLNHWCHMDYFNNVLTTFLGLEHVRSIVVYDYGGSESSRISSKISLFVFWRWTKVLCERHFTFHFWVNYPF